MSRVYTTALLIQSAELRSGVPVIQPLFKASEFLLLADKIMVDKVIPMIRARRKQHFLTSADQTTTTATAYTIPSEAMDRGLHNVSMLDSQGYEYALVPVDFDTEIGDVWGWWHNVTASNSSVRRAYYVRGDQLHLWPASVAGETLRLHYERLPNRLCRSGTYTYPDSTESPEAVQVVSVNTSTGAITCTTSAVPSTITTSTPVCVVSATPGFPLKIALSSNPTAVTSSIVTLGSDIAAVAAAGIVAGDWLCLAGDSPIVQLPIEAHSVLEQALACKLLEAISDSEGLLAAKDDLKFIIQNYEESFPLRVEQAPKKVYGGESVLDWL